MMKHTGYDARNLEEEVQNNAQEKWERLWTPFTGFQRLLTDPPRFQDKTIQWSCLLMNTAYHLIIFYGIGVGIGYATATITERLF